MDYDKYPERLFTFPQRSVRHACGLTVPTKGVLFAFYRPQRSWAKVMFLQASVILSTGGGLWQGEPPLAGRTPPSRETPWQGDPQAGRTPQQGEPPGGETPWQGEPPAGRTPPGRETPSPWAGRTPQAGRPPAGRPPQAGRTPPWQGDPPAYGQ